MARSLFASGARVVSVDYGGWDNHMSIRNAYLDKGPALDHAIAGLITDLDQRGMLDDTLVVTAGEFGRTPKINKNAGRDHWPQCGFVVLAGGGTKRGLVLGKTDKQAAYPVDRPVSAGDMAATIYQQLGVDPTLTGNDLLGRPIHIAHGGQPGCEVIG